MALPARLDPGSRQPISPTHPSVTRLTGEANLTRDPIIRSELSPHTTEWESIIHLEPKEECRDAKFGIMSIESR